MARSQKPKKPAAPKRKPWVSKPDLFAQVVAQLAHFSTKTVNTNAKSFSVRLPADHKDKLPYVSVGALGGSNINLDLYGQGQLSGIAGQVLAVWSGVPLEQKFKGVVAADVQLIQDLRDRVAARLESGSRAVDARVRQVLLPVEEGYIALSPLHATGLSHALQDRLAAEKERELQLPAESRAHPRLRGRTSFGGSMSQNMGVLAYQMHRPLVFLAPTESSAVKKAYAIHYKGISLQPPRGLLKEFYAWRAGLAERDTAGGVALRTGMASRQEEVEWIERLTRAVVARASDAAEALQAAPGFDGCLAGEVDRVVAGLILPARRYPGWMQECAQAIGRQIARFTSPDEKTRPLSDDGMARLLPVVEAVLREYA